MDTVRIGKKLEENGSVSHHITLFANDLSNYTGKDLMFECNNLLGAKRKISGEIPLYIATIIENVLNIHKTSNGARDCECYLHLLRMINESALLLNKINHDLINANIIIEGQANTFGGHLNTNRLASNYSSIFVNDDNNEEMLDETYSFIATRFDEAYSIGLENRMVNLTTEKQLFDEFQRNLLNNGSRKR